MAINTINFERFGLNSGDRVLDVGCGLGRHSLVAYRDFNVDVVGVDLGFDDLKQTQQRFQSFKEETDSKSLNLAQSDGYKLPFADECFDKVMCSEVLEHVPDYDQFVEELIRVLKPSGRLALSVPKYLPEKLCWILSDDYKELAGHVRIFKGRQLPDCVEGKGLKLKQRHSEHAIHSPYWWIRSMFFQQGEEFLPAKQYQKFLDWEVFNSPKWLGATEKVFNPLWGKSNVYYFDKN